LQARKVTRHPSRSVKDDAADHNHGFATRHPCGYALDLRPDLTILSVHEMIQELSDLPLRYGVIGRLFPRSVPADRFRAAWQIYATRIVQTSEFMIYLDSELQRGRSMKAILVRIGVDQAYGGWNAPVNPKTGQFVFVPIPDGVNKEYTPGNARGYDEIITPLAEFAEHCGVSGLCLPKTLRQRNMHLDPDFDHLTYGDNGMRRGARIATLGPNDLLVFYAGLRSIIDSSELVYALVGLFVVEEVVGAVNVRAGQRHQNAHTRWATISVNDVIVRGKDGLSGRFDRCVLIGEWRDKAYRVCRDVEDAWGGLTVKNGYIQRSVVPPAFLNASRFYSWFQEQGLMLLKRNN